MVEKKDKEEFYLPPPKISAWEGFKRFIWNSETKQIFGRTGLSWAKITLFYIIFYIALIGFFSAMLFVFFQTIDDHRPKWMLSESIIGTNPGIGFRPRPPESNVDSTLIWFKAQRTVEGISYKHWADDLNKFLESYDRPGEQGGEDIEKCEYGQPHDENKACSFDISLLNPCNYEQDMFGYAKGTPCIILKLNKIYGWIPEYYNQTKGLPDDMPDDMKEVIARAESMAPNTLNTVWVTCVGENPADVENIGPLEFKPLRGFPGYYFPFKNQRGYLSPLLAVRFLQPESGVLVNVECKAWAKNIAHDRMERRGSVHFELLVD